MPTADKPAVKLSNKERTFEVTPKFYGVDIRNSLIGVRRSKKKIIEC